MPATKRPRGYYEYGSAARKYETYETKNNISKRSKQAKTKVQAKRKLANMSTVVVILCFFAMAMIITYRYNLISEKNLNSQKLKKELEEVESALITSQIDVEQNTDVSQIEAYAKQQLGMQKPDKNQTIYVNTTNGIQKLEIEETTSGIENILSQIVEAIKNIF